jgi:hypothetical protein
MLKLGTKVKLCSTEGFTADDFQVDEEVFALYLKLKDEVGTIVTEDQYPAVCYSDGTVLSIWEQHLEDLDIAVITKRTALTSEESRIKEKYTFVKVPSPDTSDIRVGFTVGVQTFHLGYSAESLEHAEWTQDMLAKALTRLVEMENVNA